MAITAVFDTNILFSATGWRGNPFQCVERARAGEIQVVTCPELVEELADKLELRLHFSAEQVAETLADYLGFLRVVQIPKVLNAVPRDPEDNMVLECAIEGQAQYVVSGDNDLLVLKEFRGIQIVRAGDFLKVLADAQR
ncbi:MAG TPA: putative toxin-antitoxin system toxin component, PIN family [Candidatus Baltobacteraceae bacterium]|nr:putative toxin-antitoxin system toxin component, PIN family [Candidatus Baltobacteraceae bacterium]